MASAGESAPSVAARRAAMTRDEASVVSRRPGRLAQAAAARLVVRLLDAQAARG